MIPGYQPVEKLGRTPSFGVWVRAVQTRLDRPVLLKLLNAGGPTLEALFAREISALVRLDGQGALRVIAEGSAGLVRYLVLDEAAALPVAPDAADGSVTPGRVTPGSVTPGSATPGSATPGSVTPGSATASGGATSSLDPEAWRALAETLEDLFRAIRDQGLVLLPVPAAALRRLPTGQFVVGDLGVLLSPGEMMPTQAPVPATLQGQPVESGLNVCLLGATLVGLGRTWQGMPRWLAQVASQLERQPPSEGERLLAQPRRLVAPARPLLQRPVGWGAVALALLLGAWASYVTLRQDDPRSGPREVTSSTESPDNGVADLEPRASGNPGQGVGEGSEGPDTAGGEGAIPGTGVGGGTAEARRLEAAAQAEFARLVPDDQAVTLTIPAPLAQQLASLQARFPATQAAQQAGRLLKLGRLASEQEGLRLWETVAARLQRALLAGDHAAAESYLATLAGVVLPDPVDEVRAHFAQELTTSAELRRAQLAQALDHHAAQRTYGAARELAEAALPRLRAQDRAWLEERVVQLSEAAGRYEAARTGLERAIVTGLDRTAQGDWAAAETALASAIPGSEFAELEARHGAWVRALEEGSRSAAAVRAGVQQWKDTEGVRSVTLAGSEEPLKGRVTGIEGPLAFELKLDGRTGRSAVAWRELTALSLSELASLTRTPGTEVTPARAAQLLFWLGEEARALAEVAALFPDSGTPGPERPGLEWLELAQEVGLRKQAERLASRFQEARAAFSGQRWEELRKLYDDLRSQLPEATRLVHREEFRAWLAGYWRARGPGAAFPGANVVSYRDGRLELEFDFEDKRAAVCWVTFGASRTEWRSRTLFVQGSALLLPEGLPRDAPSSEVFEEDLRVTAELASTERRNLNLVLFAALPAGSSRGVIFGLGFQPPRLAGVDKTDQGRVARVILPANVVGLARNLERGQAEEPEFVSITPKVDSQRSVRLVASWHDGVAVLEWRERGARMEARPTLEARERRGTVELRTFGDPLLVRRVGVEGRLRPAWLEAWIALRVAADL